MDFLLVLLWLENCMGSKQDAPGWTFLTNHAHVLLCLAKEPTCRMRDIALDVGITERAVQRIITELEQAGYVTRMRDGRRNEYTINRSKLLRHPLEEECRIGQLLDLLERAKKEAE